jgi:ABC-type Na+ transport system ATPase subunit NatA
VPSLTLDHLDKSFGTVRALHDLSFDVAAGEIFGFVGSNGAGKSTTMRIVLGVLALDSGEVRWDGSPIDHRTRWRIGYMPEERGLYPRMKVGDQLTYLARLHGMDAVAARRSMEHWTEVLGIDGRRGDEILKLSLGNQQRVQLAAALVHEPVILVLDEPFSGLDPVAVDVMSGVLREQAGRRWPHRRPAGHERATVADRRNAARRVAGLGARRPGCGDGRNADRGRPVFRAHRRRRADAACPGAGCWTGSRVHSPAPDPGRPLP